MESASRESSPLSDLSSDDEEDEDDVEAEEAEAMLRSPSPMAVEDPAPTVVSPKSDAEVDPNITALLGRFALDLYAVKDKESTTVMQRFWADKMESVVKPKTNEESKMAVVEKEDVPPTSASEDSSSDDTASVTA